jgi:hypothetical protein
MAVLALPFSMTFEVSMQKAEAEMNRKIESARKIQRWFRYRMRLQKWRQRYDEYQRGGLSMNSLEESGLESDASEHVGERASRTAQRFMAQIGGPCIETDETNFSSITLVDNLVSSLSDERFRRALETVKAKEMQTGRTKYTLLGID